MEISESQHVHPEEKSSFISDNADLFIHINRYQEDLAERKKNIVCNNIVLYMLREKIAEKLFLLKCQSPMEIVLTFL